MVNQTTAPAGSRSHKSINRPLTRFRVATSALRVLPDYIIIGAQKCGTSSLYRYLNEHPAVAAAAGKEVHYFDWHYRRGTGWYRAHFPTTAYRELFKARTGMRLVTGEASPYYLFHPHAAKRVKALVPGARLIALLRDPVERTISAYQHQVRSGTESLSFAEALDREPARLAAETERLRRDELYKSDAHRQFSYLARGRYAEQLAEWYRHFSRDQLLIVRSEDLFTQPATTLQQVFAFIGLPAWEPAEFYRFNSGDYAEIDDAVRRRLIDYFAQPNQRLYDLIGRDMGWRR
jgi:hypothetical protein